MKDILFIGLICALLFACLVIGEVAEQYGIPKWGEGDRELEWSDGDNRDCSKVIGFEYGLKKSGEPGILYPMRALTMKCGEE
jgi:hypothetical protein